MKKTIATLMIAALTSTLLLAGIGKTKSSTTGDELRNKVERQLEYPKEILKGEEEVAVRTVIAVDGSGKLMARKIETSDPRLAAYISQRLQNISLNALPEQEGQQFVLVIRFKLV